MEFRVQLKICEACGCLWYRPQAQAGAYCLRCEKKLKDFPTPESRKRRGRPSRKVLAKVWAVATDFTIGADAGALAGFGGAR